MFDTTSITNVLIGAPADPARFSPLPGSRQHSASAPQPGSDGLELSAAAANENPSAEASGALEQRIDDLRARIASGTYLTADKIDAVVDRLFEEVFGN